MAKRITIGWSHYRVLRLRSQATKANRFSYSPVTPSCISSKEMSVYMLAVAAEQACPRCLCTCCKFQVFPSNWTAIWYPKNRPIFTRLRLQASYNPKGRYLPIPRKCCLCKLFVISALQKAQKMWTYSMAVLGTTYKKELTVPQTASPFGKWDGVWFYSKRFVSF